MQTSKEKINNIFNHKNYDELGLYEWFWDSTKDKWLEQERIKDTHSSRLRSFENHFNFDITQAWVANYKADPSEKEIIIDEDEKRIIKKDSNGAIMKYLKNAPLIGEHIDFMVKCQDDFKEHIKEKLLIAKYRVDADEYKKALDYGNATGKSICYSTPGIWESMHAMCGHENLCVGMALEPDWVCDMVNIYSNIIISEMEKVFSKHGSPDFLWFFEDLGYKGTTFFSNTMYKELIMPGHKKIFDFAHSKGLNVMLHSCGFIEPLLPLLIEAGIDGLQAMEVKAGMDSVRIAKNYGEKIALMGGIDIRAIASNDKRQIDKEIEKIMYLNTNHAYIAHSDHSVPPETEYEAFCHYIKGIKNWR